MLRFRMENVYIPFNTDLTEKYNQPKGEREYFRVSERETDRQTEKT